VFGLIPPGAFYNAGHFAPGAAFAGTDPVTGGLVCSVTGSIGDGALYAATNPVFSGAACPALSLIPNKPGNNPCQGISFISVGVVALAELQINFNVQTLGGPVVNSGDNEAVAAVLAIPGACPNNISMDCAFVVGAAGVLPVNL